MTNRSPIVIIRFIIYPKLAHILHIIIIQNSPLALTFFFLLFNAASNALCKLLSAPPPPSPPGGSPLPAGPESEPGTAALLLSRIWVLSTFFNAPMPPAFWIPANNPDRSPEGTGRAGAGGPDV